jgi:ADP-ribose pyrophosphatase YjhB (NUDIX family)
VQYAALPWRVNGGRLEILLITTLKTRRWIVPKGWPVETLSPQACAAHEALEEAGVSGALSEKPIGVFRYFKRRKDGEVVACKVDVFALEVTQQRRSWVDTGARDRPLRPDDADRDELKYCACHSMSGQREPARVAMRQLHGVVQQVCRLRSI